jgi:hypothetical protein
VLAVRMGGCVVSFRAALNSDFAKPGSGKSLPSIPPNLVAAVIQRDRIPGLMRIVVLLALLFFQAVVFADQLAPIRPDPKLTPGATFDVTLRDISEPGYSKKVRNVTGEVKREVYAEYGITEHQPGEYEVDHLIPLSIGGSNSIKNLWQESYRTVWNAHVKDRLEDRLHALVIGGKLDLETAQREIANDWIAAYKKYVGPSPDSGHRLGYARVDVASPSDLRGETAATEAKVWVNTRSAWPAMVRQDQTRRVHERSRGNPQRVPGCERRIDSCLTTPNHKLTNVIKGRIVEDLQMNPAEVAMRFSDGSTMRVKVMESNSPR